MSGHDVRPNDCSLATRFSRDESGTVAILFGLMAIVLFALVGGAIDYGRAVHARYQIQEAVDSAVLAAARVWQMEHDLTLAKEKGYLHYNNNKPASFSSEVSKFTQDVVNSTISMEATGLVPTPFLSVLHVNNYTVGATAQARLQVGQDEDGQKVEVSMMLDVTGSMCDSGNSCTSGRKIDALKRAATKLIDTVVWKDHSEFSKVAIVPFSLAVRLPSSANTAARGDLPSKKTVGTGKNAKTVYLTPCVVERIGAEKNKDTAPGPGQYVMGHYVTSSNPTCIGAGATVVPLASNKQLLKDTIKNLTASGGTAGQIGTAWAWYMLSPNWADLWPAENQPKAYGTDKLIKYAILMTDGEYNTQYDANGVSSSNGENGSSTTQAQSLCTEMKKPDKGIVVYTIGFELDSNTAVQTLRNCASSPDKFYDAKDEVELEEAFQSIALQIAKLSLSQ